MNRQHGGNLMRLAQQAGRAPAQLLDFGANIIPLGPPDCVDAALTEADDWLGHYPDPDSTELVDAVAAHLDVDPASIVSGNGAEQLIWWLPRLLSARRIVLPSPCYQDYGRSAEVWDTPVVRLPLDWATDFALDFVGLERELQTGDLVWIGQPSNPAGRLADPGALLAAVAARRDVHWAIDEAFIDFTPEGRTVAAAQQPNLIVIRSMTKFYAIPALRLGYAVLPVQRAARLRGLLPDWSVNTFAQRVGTAVLRDANRSLYAERSRRLIAVERGWLIGQLRALGAAVVEGAANYLFFRLPQDAPLAPDLALRLLQRDGIAVRVCASYAGLTDSDRYLRIAVRRRPDNARLVAALAAQVAAGGTLPQVPRASGSGLPPR